jgi:hypothetical protein
MFSERQNDGLERSRGGWFRRANTEHPERGGAPKSRTFHGPAWIEQARERWAALSNSALERAGRGERVDHRSYDRQGVDREPGEHYGPAAAHMVGRDDDHDHLDRASAVIDDAQALQAIESQIARLEAAKEAMPRDGLPDTERQPRATRLLAFIVFRPQRRSITGAIVMASALETFRAQREAVDQLHARLAEAAELLRALQRQVDAIAQNRALREVLRDEHTWLEQAQRTIADVRAYREQEMRRFWPAVWRRWAVAVAFALAATAAFGAGYVWANRPSEAELVLLRSRVDILDDVAQRVLRMTPTERRQFDGLMKWNVPSNR